MTEIINYEELVSIAYKAKQYSYAPYSQFHVGAALLCMDGTVYTGCNVENAAYSPTNCAERTAVFKAVSEGRRSFRAIAIVGDKHAYLPPCGVCRQVLAEFCVNNTDFEIILAKSQGEYQVKQMQELFPFSFSSDDLSS